MTPRTGTSAPDPGSPPANHASRHWLGRALGRVGVVSRPVTSPVFPETPRAQCRSLRSCFPSRGANELCFVVLLGDDRLRGEGEYTHGEKRKKKQYNIDIEEIELEKLCNEELGNHEWTVTKRWMSSEWWRDLSRGQGEVRQCGTRKPVALRRSVTWSGVKKRANWRTLRGVHYFDSFHFTRKVSREILQVVDRYASSFDDVRISFEAAKAKVVSFRASSGRETETKEKEKGKKRKVSRTTWASTEEQPASARRRWHKE